MDRVLVFDWMCKDEIYTHVVVNFTTGVVECTDYIDDFVFQFLGRMPRTIDSVLTVLEMRCIPRGRADVQEILGMMGLKEYNPFEIVKVTHGHTISDDMWVRFEGENLKYDDINVIRRR